MISSSEVLSLALDIFVLGTAFLVVKSRNIVHALFSLVLCFLGVAGIYANLGCGFLALAQVMVYAGAIAVLILFAILTVAEPDMGTTNPTGNRWLMAGILLFAFAAISTYLLCKSDWPSNGLTALTDSVGPIGELLLGRYAVPLEAAAILLLIALIGAVILIKEDK